MQFKNRKFWVDWQFRGFEARKLEPTKIYTLKREFFFTLDSSFVKQTFSTFNHQFSCSCHVNSTFNSSLFILDLPLQGHHLVSDTKCSLSLSLSHRSLSLCHLISFSSFQLIGLLNCVVSLLLLYVLNFSKFVVLWINLSFVSMFFDFSVFCLKYKII